MGSLYVGIASPSPSLLGRYIQNLLSYNDSFVPELVLGPSGRVELEGWDRVNQWLPVSLTNASFNASFDTSGISFSVSDLTVTTQTLPTGGSPTAGQMVATTTPAVIETNTPCKTLLIQADPGNTPDILLGTSSGQYIRLTPGASIEITVTNTNQIYVTSSSAAGTVNWLAINS